MFEKKYINQIQQVTIQKTATHNLNPNDYKKIKKGNKVEIVLQNGKNRQQTIEGICTKIKKNTYNPAITIKYKLSGVIIEQRIPFGLKEFLKINLIKN